MNKSERLKQIADELREMFLGMTTIEFVARSYGDNKSHEVTVHGIETYAESTELFRSFGIGVRHKTPYNDELIGKYTAVVGTEGPLTLRTYPNELPPSCHIEKVVERIPKQKTVDTGEFIEVEREKIVCWEAA